MRFIKYFVLGILFGVMLVKSEVMSWFRIQEMFRFESFHMFGIMGCAIAVAMFSIFIIRRYNLKTMDGKPVVITGKPLNKGTVIGGLLFGMGWAITGACPGPLFAQVGSGYLAVLLTIVSAIAGTWVYGLLRDKLPH